MGTCSGSPSFNLINPNSFSEWPAKISGLICKTPPFGIYSAPRFSQCCSGEVFNITTPTTPDDPAYPMSCALFCQLDPALYEDTERSTARPLGFNDHILCITDGLDLPLEWDVVCAENPVEGVPAPTSFPSTPTGSWKTKDYSDYCEEHYPACVDPWGSSDSVATTRSAASPDIIASGTSGGESTPVSDIMAPETTLADADSTEAEDAGSTFFARSGLYYVAPLLLIMGI